MSNTVLFATIIFLVCAFQTTLAGYGWPLLSCPKESEDYCCEYNRGLAQMCDLPEYVLNLIVDQYPGPIILGLLVVIVLLALKDCCRSYRYI